MEIWIRRLLELNLKATRRALRDDEKRRKRMSKGKECIFVRCPYYRREERNLLQLKCEGLLEGTDLYQRFENGERMRRHKEVYCMKDYRRCPLAEALDRKYEYV